jgi:serine/threonine-protein kinase
VADPREPVDPVDETIVRDEWGDETVVVEEREEIVPPRRPPLLWPWLLAFLILVLGGLGAYWYFSQDDDEPATTTTSTARTTTAEALVQVPDVVGTTSSEATATLRQAGFDVNVVAVPSDLPSGQVVAQEPAAGEEAAKDSIVRLNVAREAAATTGPSATGTTAPQTTTTEPSTTTSATTTAPAPTPPRPATVPDVVGQELADAARAFGDEGLKVSVKPVPSNEARGTVIAQAQPPGTERKRGDTVQVNVALGANPPASVAVPDTAGLPQRQARERLEAAGFEVLAIELETTDGSGEGRVLSHTPSGGAQIPRGSLVILYVGVATS